MYMETSNNHQKNNLPKDQTEQKIPDLIQGIGEALDFLHTQGVDYFQPIKAIPSTQSEIIKCEWGGACALVDHNVYEKAWEQLTTEELRKRYGRVMYDFSH